MADNLPAGYLKLAEASVTRLEKTEEDEYGPQYPAGSVDVRVREDFDQVGQWVGTYTLEDATLVADRIADATYGMIHQRWTPSGERISRITITMGGKLADVAHNLRALQKSMPQHVRDAHAAGMSKSRIHELTGIARTTIDRWLADR